MVKRTVAVLGILAVTLAAGTSFAFWGVMGLLWRSSRLQAVVLTC